MKFQPAYDRMKAIIESPDCVLSGYEVDFYDFDRLHLESTGTVGGRYVWVVRQNGTHLASIGLHPKMTEFVDCALDMKEPLQVYELTLLADGDALIKSITVAKAKELIKQSSFDFNGRHVKQKGQLIALVDVEKHHDSKGWGGKVSFTFDTEPSEDRKSDFKQIALVLLQQSVGTYFFRMDEVTFKTQSLR